MVTNSLNAYSSLIHEFLDNGDKDLIPIIEKIGESIIKVLKTKSNEVVEN